MLRVISGIAGIALLTLVAISVGNSPVVFFDGPSVLLVVGIVGFGTLVSFPPARIWSACSLSADPAAASPVFHRMADLAVSAGIFGVLIGLVQILQSVDDPNALGPAMAVCLLTLFYGVGLGELVFRGLANRGPPSTASVQPSRRGTVPVYLPLTVTVLVVCLFGLMVLVAHGL